MLPYETECWVCDPDYPDDGHTLSFGEFVSANSDCYDNEDYARISKKLLEEGKFVDGGGAAPVFVLSLKNWKAVAAMMIETISAKGERRRQASADPDIKALHPAGVDWLLPDERELYEAAQCGYARTKDSIEEIRRRVKIKRLRRRYGLPT